MGWQSQTWFSEWTINRVCLPKLVFLYKLSTTALSLFFHYVITAWLKREFTPFGSPGMVPNALNQLSNCYCPNFSDWFSHGQLVGVFVDQSCLTLFDPVDCSPPVSSVHSFLQARILEWVAFPFSRGSSWPRDWTPVSCITGRFFIIWATREVHGQLT